MQQLSLTAKPTDPLGHWLTGVIAWRFHASHHGNWTLSLLFCFPGSLVASLLSPRVPPIWSSNFEHLPLVEFASKIPNTQEIRKRANCSEFRSHQWCAEFNMLYIKWFRVLSPKTKKHPLVMAGTKDTLFGNGWLGGLTGPWQVAFFKAIFWKTYLFCCAF